MEWIVFFLHCTSSILANLFLPSRKCRYALSHVKTKYTAILSPQNIFYLLSVDLILGRTERTQTLTKHYREDFPAKSMQGTKFSKLTAEWKTCSQLINKPKQDLFMQLKELLTTNDILPGDLIANWSRYIKIKFSPLYCRMSIEIRLFFAKRVSHI